MKFLAATMTLLLSASPAMAFELYHCTVNDVTDGYFNSIDLKVDGQKISGSTVIEGRATELKDDTFGYFYTGNDGRQYVAIMYQPNRDMAESLGFNLQDVTGKLGTADRYSEREGFGEIDRTVQMTCDMATPL